jgi:hypothetical protein
MRLSFHRVDPAAKLLNGLVAPVSRWLRQRDPGASWQSAAEAAGLKCIRRNSFLWFTTSVEGWRGSLHVEIRSANERRRAPLVRITVKGIARWLRLGPEDVGSRLQTRLGMQEEIRIGDDAFDGDFLIQGDPRMAHALLDTEARASLRRLYTVAESAGLGDGRLVADHSEDTAGSYLADVLEQALDAAQRLVEPEDVAARIARNAVEDRAERVRRQCLRALLAHHRDHALTRETLRRACRDPGEDIRLEAALALEEEGHPVLRALASAAVGEGCAARAITGLGEGLEATEALSLLEQSLERRRDQVAVACLETLGRREPATVPTGLEPVLLQRALVHPAEDLRVAAAAALGRVGTVAAVLPLQEAAQRAGGAARRAMQGAARAIQSRLTGAERGQLTVAGAEGGTVTLASEGGQVSLPDPNGAGGE